MNERTRANVDDKQGQPVISQDRRDDKLLAADDPAPSAG
jgi:hypothetical protein